jgi:hypothetical protein
MVIGKVESAAVLFGMEVLAIRRAPAVNHGDIPQPTAASALLRDWRHLYV